MKYLVIFYIEDNITVSRKELKTMSEKELLTLIDSNRDNYKNKFAVYELGDCVLDWS